MMLKREEVLIIASIFLSVDEFKKYKKNILNEYAPISDNDYIYSIIKKTFCWEDTGEGFRYWALISDRLIGMKTRIYSLETLYKPIFNVIR